MSTPASPPAPAGYPPAPWRLRGQAFFSSWLVPLGRCSVQVDPALEPLVIAGRVCVAAGFVDYQEGSVLTYGELVGILAVKPRGSRRFGGTVTCMWVDSERSLRGGRALWGMPKELGRFELEHRPPEADFSGAAWDARGTELARARFHVLPGLPRAVRLPLGFPNLQVMGGRVFKPGASLRCSPRLARASWSIPEGSPLASLGLRGARPVMSLCVRDFALELSECVPVD